jgi:glutamine synthetase
MVGLGWSPYQNDHEDANGQFEINWNFNDALTTADQLCFFKFMVKSIAEQHGLRATFMPKPFANLTGNGCHVHMSVWDGDRKVNRFHDPGEELGLSSEAYHFLGGLMHTPRAWRRSPIRPSTATSASMPRALFRAPPGRRIRDLRRQQPHPHGESAR